MAWFDDLNLPGSTIDGYFGFVTADGPDEDDNPDVMLADGTVTFIATTPAARVNGTWLGIQPVTAKIFEGRLVVSEEYPQPIRLLATDANIGVADWAWKARFDLKGFQLSELTFKAPRDTTVNLTADLIPIKSQPYQIIEGASIVDAEVSGEGTMRFALSDGSYTKWMDVPNGPRGLPGSPGEKGDRGDNGEAATLSMGSVTAGAAADAWMTGTPLARELNLTLPRGQKGDKGDRGDSSITDPQVASYVSAETATKSALRDGFVERHGKRGVTRTLYVRETGNDSNPGTAAAPFREIRAAMAALESGAPEIRGTVVVDVGPGTYKGGIRPPVTRGALQDDFLTIRGPAVGGHPNVPTAVVSHAADTSATYGIQALNGAWLWVQDIKISGPFGTGLDARSSVTLQRRNVHIDGAAIGVNVTSYVSDNSFGGIIQNCTTYGVQEMYNVTRTYGGGIGQGTIIRNNPTGIYSKSNCFGHLDDAVFENNAVAIHLDGGRANLLRVAISGSTVCGISLKDSEIHNDYGMTWGAGNTRRVLSYGPASTESDMLGWGNSPQATLRDMLRPLILMRHQYTPVTVTGTTANTPIATWATLLPADRFAVEGKKLRVKVNGTLLGSSGNPSVLAGAMYVNLLVGGSQMLAIPIPAGTRSGEFVAEVEMTSLADGGDLYFTGTYTTKYNGAAAFNATRTKDISSAAATVQVRVQPYNASDSCTVQMVEVYG